MTLAIRSSTFQLWLLFLLFCEAECRTISSISSSSYAGRLRGLLSSHASNAVSPEQHAAVQHINRPVAHSSLASLTAESKRAPTDEQQQLLDVLPSWWFSSPTTTTTTTKRPTMQIRMDALYKDLVAGTYQRDVRPQHNCGDDSGCSDPLPVQVGLKFVKFLGLDEKDSVLSVQVILSLMWPDERLDYDAATNPALGPWDYEEDSIPVEASKLWVPDIQLANAAAPTEKIFAMTEPKAFVYNSEKRHRDGFNVRIRQPAVMRVKCELDLSKFPFDGQTCKFVFRPWSSNTKWVNLLPAKGDQFEASELSEKSEEFSVVKITENETRYDQDELGDGAEHFTQVEFTLDLQRHLHFYMARLILPMVMIVVLSAGLFYMKLSDSRVMVGVTLVLTVMSVSSFSASLLPNSGGEDTWIERFQSDCYLAVMTPLFASLFLLLLHRLLVEDNLLGASSVTHFAGGLVAADACLRLLFILYILWFTYRVFAIQAVSESQEPSVYWVRLYLIVVITLMTVLALLEIFWCARGGQKRDEGMTRSVSFGPDVASQRSSEKKRSINDPKNLAAGGEEIERGPVDGPGGAVTEEDAAAEVSSEESSNHGNDEDDEEAEQVAASSRASLPVNRGHVKRLQDNFASSR